MPKRNAPLISVIVPVYNTQDSLEACVNSIIRSAACDIEILLVDDGSKDKSLQIIQKLARDDSRITIFSKPNGGLSTARNMGLDNAKGDYVLFVDSDDEIEEALIGTLLKNMVETSSDISCCGIVHVREGAESVPFEDKTLKVFSHTQAIEALFNDKYIPFSACAKLYKMSLFKKIRFPVGELHEDVYITYELLTYCKNVCSQMLPLYRYNMNDSGITGKPFSPARLNDITAREKIVFEVGNKYPQFAKNALNIKLVGYLNMANKLVYESTQTKKAYLKPIISDVRKNASKYLFCKHINKKKKLGVLLLCLGGRFYKLGLKANG